MPRRHQHAEAKKFIPPPVDLPTADERRESLEDALKVPRGWLKRPYRLARAIQELEHDLDRRRQLIRWLCEERGVPMGKVFDAQAGWRTVAQVLGEMARLERGSGQA